MFPINMTKKTINMYCLQQRTNTTKNCLKLDNWIQTYMHLLLSEHRQTDTHTHTYTHTHTHLYNSKTVIANAQIRMYTTLKKSKKKHYQQ
jgi:hypothetical protein